MIEIGKKQILRVINTVDFGVYVGFDEDNKVLLPKKQVPEDTEVGDSLEVFIYRDSEDRMIATSKEPFIQLGQTAKLKVKEVSKVGAFLDWGLEKDLMLPYKQQEGRVKAGEEYLVALYIDKSSRLCATMKIERYLEIAKDYKLDQEVEATIYELKDRIGAFVAVDNKYIGLIHRKDIHSELKVGMSLKGRVSGIKEDGKLDISINQKAYLQRDEDAANILSVIKAYNGQLPYGEKVSPEIIERDFHMSKAAFKRAIGKLYKEGAIVLEDESISIKK